MSEQGVWGRHRKLVSGRESETRTASHLSALSCQGEASGVSCPPMFFVPVFTWTTCNTVNKRSHKRLAEQAKQAEVLLAFSSHPGLCALSTVNLWAVLLISSPRCFNPKSSFSPPFTCPNTCHFLFPNGIFNSGHFSICICTYPNNSISIRKGGSIRRGMSSQKFQGRAETSLMGQF